MLQAFLMLLAGIGVLYVAAEALIRGSCGIAARLGISPLIVGVTVVALGTSLPEVITSIMAHVFQGKSEIALGNVIGSNVANIGLVLGFSALLHPVDISTQVRHRELPIVVVVTLIFMAILATGGISRFAGVILLLGILSYTLYQVYLARMHLLSQRRTAILEEESLDAVAHSQVVDSVFVIVGLLGLMLGGHLLVEGAVTAAELFGVSERVIGLTIVAAGTSCPELATSLLAAYKKQHDISVGNIVGSNLFNILLTIGLCAAILPMAVPAKMVSVDASVMLALTLVVAACALYTKRISRSVGALLLVSYLAYITFLVLF